MDENSSGFNLSSWESWIQDVAKNVIQTKTQAQYVAPVELDKMRLQAFGPYGQPYYEGVANAKPATIAGIPTTWLLLGGLVALVVVLKD